MSKSAEVTYWDYIKVNELLDLQGGLTGDESALANDEVHFIVVHQVFELWFKVVLRELLVIRDRLSAERVNEVDIPFVVGRLRRINEIWRSAIAHWSVVETLAPQGFLAFRDRLRPASGFQSDQLRAIELVMGLDEELRMQKLGGFDPVANLLEAARRTGSQVIASRLERVREDVKAKGSVRQALYSWLLRTPIQGEWHDAPRDLERVEQFIQEYLDAIQTAGMQAADNLTGAQQARAREGVKKEIDEARSFLHASDFADKATEVRVSRIRAGILFIETYRELPLLTWPRMVIDSIVEMEELFLLWRYRHARMVERMIGRRFGTGGSEGVAYLDKTSEFRIFYDLWMARRLLVPGSFRPELKNPKFYEFESTARLMV